MGRRANRQKSPTWKPVVGERVTVAPVSYPVAESLRANAVPGVMGPLPCQTRRNSWGVTSVSR